MRFLLPGSGTLRACTQAQRSRGLRRGPDLADLRRAPGRIATGGDQLARAGFGVRTKRVGNHPDLKVLLLHGGPAATDEVHEPFDAWFSRAVVPSRDDDQVGSVRGDQPQGPTLCDLARVVDEVERSAWRSVSTAATSSCSAHRGGRLSRWSAPSTTGSAARDGVISTMMSGSRPCDECVTDVLMPAMHRELLAEIQSLEAEGRGTTRATSSCCSSTKAPSTSAGCSSRSGRTRHARPLPSTR